MCPFEFFREARKVTGCGYSAGRAPSDIGKVGKVAPQLFLVFIIKRQVPGAVAGGFAGGAGHDVLAEVLSDLCRHPDATVSADAATRLQERRPRPSAGFLTGVIDLVFRSPQGHWVVLDWKTNRLNRPVTAIMAASDYWLQAEIYRRAVVRFLRWRLDLAPGAPCPVDAVMLFTRAGTGAWLRDPGGSP